MGWLTLERRLKNAICSRSSAEERISETRRTVLLNSIEVHYDNTGTAVIINVNKIIAYEPRPWSELYRLAHRTGKHDGARNACRNIQISQLIIVARSRSRAHGRARADRS